MTVLQVTFQPFGVLNALRARFAIPFVVTLLLRIALFAPKETFVYKTLDGCTVMLAVAATAVSMLYFVLIESEDFGKIRSVFDSRPWRNTENVYLTSGSPTAANTQDATKRSTCPFTNKAPKGVCPICCTCTSRDGYHHGDPQKLHNAVGVSMIEYEMARKATEREDSPILGRVQLDALVNYRANYFFGTISPSCKGCYMKSWCWNVAYRMTWQSAIIAFNSMLATFIFKNDITIVYADLKNICLCVSAFFSVSTVCMQLSILATAVVFILEHPFMDKSSIPKWIDVSNATLMEWIYYFANPASKFGTVPTKKYWAWLEEK
mmetsp:Transcript_40532/g.100176  ORF Transcript_40532/g.100176 Transcript_40532/m.100176 type:complete len:321 (-) Transcript_40532:1314-2276(-)|eukprot:CAMPEP_0197575178 /NCGR_PEP_ID=MMETSP1326-20131121/659_1 /TAXON_ID=1155430 /ORGANISM="Genus nov. species nov., Strain RCC2288" /LENGTH=320 /DNA_ID=CAMNT_0043137893 /DNA_START=149 /DNA_END=1111 /DNA_ORIENTATION=-